MTKAWTVGEQRLRYFNFATKDFGQRSSKRLFAQRDVNDTETEQRLNKWIETPLAQYLEGATSSGGLARIIHERWWKNRLGAPTFLYLPDVFFSPS